MMLGRMITMHFPYYISEWWTGAAKLFQKSELFFYSQYDD